MLWEVFCWCCLGPLVDFRGKSKIKFGVKSNVSLCLIVGAFFCLVNAMASVLWRQPESTLGNIENDKHLDTDLDFIPHCNG